MAPLTTGPPCDIRMTASCEVFAPRSFTIQPITKRPPALPRLGFAHGQTVAPRDRSKRGQHSHRSVLFGHRPLKYCVGLMGWLHPNPKLDAGEQIVWKRSCGMVVRSTTSMGMLYVTSARVMFVPHRANLPSPWLWRRHAWLRAEIESVDVAQPDHSLGYAGGMARRLRLSLRSGDSVLFRIAKKDPDRVAAELLELIAARSRCIVTGLG